MNKILLIIASTNLVAAHAISNNYINIKFDISMQKNTLEYKKKYTNNVFNKTFIEKLKKLYEKNNAENVSVVSEPKIPLIIHQIWVGPNKLPDFYKKLINTWKEMHPDWTHILWTDVEAQQFKLRNQKAYDRAKSYSEKANILRLEVLREYGGVYVDIDFECLKPLDILHYCYDFYTGITPNNANAVLANGIIGSIPQHPLLSRLVDHMKEYENKLDQVSRNGVQYFSSVVSVYLNNNHEHVDIALPATYFYPFKKHYGTQISADDFIRPESFAIHYWGSTLEQKINLYNQKR